MKCCDVCGRALLWDNSTKYCSKRCLRAAAFSPGGNRAKEEE